MASGIIWWFFQNEKLDKNNFVTRRKMKVILHYLNNGDYNYKHFLSKNWNIFSPSFWARTKSKLQLKLIPDEGQEMGLLVNTRDKSATAQCA